MLFSCTGKSTNHVNQNIVLKKNFKATFQWFYHIYSNDSQNTHTPYSAANEKKKIKQGGFHNREPYTHTTELVYVCV